MFQVSKGTGISLRVFIAWKIFSNDFAPNWLRLWNQKLYTCTLQAVYKFIFYVHQLYSLCREIVVKDCVRLRLYYKANFSPQQKLEQRKRRVQIIRALWNVFVNNWEIWCNAFIHSTPRSFFIFLHRITSCRVTSGICTKQNRGRHACIRLRALILDTKLSSTVVILQLSENSNIQERTEDGTLETETFRMVFLKTLFVASPFNILTIDYVFA